MEFSHRPSTLVSMDPYRIAEIKNTGILAIVERFIHHKEPE